MYSTISPRERDHGRETVRASVLRKLLDFNSDYGTSFQAELNIAEL